MKEFIGDALWTEVGKNGVVKLGFSRQFIETKLGECFHVLQADTVTVKKNGPLLVLETNDGLESVKSPISGSVLYFNSKARNFPDRLTEEDSILDILPEGVKLVEEPKTAKKVTKVSTSDFFINDFNVALEQLNITNRGI